MLSNFAARFAPGVTNLEELLPDRPAVPVMAREYQPLIVPLRPRVVGDIQATLWIPLSAAALLAADRLRQRLQPVLGPRRKSVTARWRFAPLAATPRGWPGSVLLVRLAFGEAGGRRDAAHGPRGGAAAGPLRAAGVAAGWRRTRFDSNILLFDLTVSLAARLLFGLLPARKRRSRVRLHDRECARRPERSATALVSRPNTAHPGPFEFSKGRLARS